MRRLIHWCMMATNLASWSAALHAQEAKDVAVMLKAAGEVFVRRVPAQSEEPARRGTRLHSGNLVRTGEESAAALIFTDDKSILKVRANARVNIAGKRENDSVLKTIKLEIGQLWARVTRSTSAFQVETPSGVAAVKGTVFYCLADEDGNMIVFCLEGAVELYNALGRVLVNAGYTGKLGPNQAPTVRPSQPGEVPTWGEEGEEGGSIEIELQDAQGQQKRLKLQY